ncbi:putative nuclease HARBI1 [Heptranchias perlo]|uniref:putative nuclease HARBI1 n=1 Tax=Heptranchias perlo TaxID=212740 RepID=UPI00355A3E07
MYLRRREQQRTVRCHACRLIRKHYYPPECVYRERLTFEMFSEELCVRRLCFSKEAIGRLCEMLQEDLWPRSTSYRALSVAMKITTALKFCKCGSFQAGTGNITQNAARVCIHQVTGAIFRRASEFINLDLSSARQRDTSIAFHRIAGFPKVQGAVDRIHVALKVPNDAPFTCTNRKGFHSLNVMLLCDAGLRIMSTCMKSSLERGKDSGWILGDKGYPLKPWLMSPYRRTNSAAQERYNRAHMCTCQVAERTIGLLKSHFCCLDSPDKVSRIVVVCCTLHNFALRDGLTVN